MRSKAKISLILPSLNVRPYIEECLTSVRAQSLRDIEILCVDAGSTDGTREIIAAHAAEDGRIRLLDSRVRSVGHQVNLGIEAAQGTYVGIVETDDYVTPDMYAGLYAAAEAHQAELVLSDYRAFWGQEAGGRQFLSKAVARPAQYNRLIEPGREQEVFDNDMSIWTGIYRRDFLMENNIREQETRGAAYQDQGFWFQCFACAKGLLYLQNAEDGYRYRLDNSGSSIHSKGMAYAICEEYDFIKEQLKQRSLWEKYQETYKRLQFNRYLWNYLRLEEPEQLQFLQRFQQENELPVPAEEFHARRMQEREALQAVLRGGSPVIIFGCGSDGIRMLDYLRSKGELGRITCLTDNNAELHGTTLFGIPVLAPQRARQDYPEACYILASLNYSKVIREQLLTSGVKEDHLWSGHVC